MPRFFPTPDNARAAREMYTTATLKDALPMLDAGSLETPRTRDWRDMVEEYCTLLEALGVPDRDGVDFAVIVPVMIDGDRHSRSVSLDIGRRALCFASDPKFGCGPLPDDVVLGDPDLAKNLRDALLPVLVTYKNPRSVGDFEG